MHIYIRMAYLKIFMLIQNLGKAASAKNERKIKFKQQGHYESVKRTVT